LRFGIYDFMPFQIRAALRNRLRAMGRSEILGGTPITAIVLLVAEAE
jgi:hypothetical protein